MVRVIKFSTFEMSLDDSSIAYLKKTISKSLGLSVDDFYLLCNGKRLQYLNDCPTKPVHVVLRNVGGKGGFGSMLRAIGAQIEKTTNREACRDLSGRRLRDINEEKRLKNWISQTEERECEAAKKKRQKLERMCQEPKIELKDESYMKQRLELSDNIRESIEKGLKAGGSGTKRKWDERTLPVNKKKTLILDMDLDSDDDSSEDDTYSDLSEQKDSGALNNLEISTS